MPSSDETFTIKKLKALIVDGQNNHGIWPKTSMMMKEYLEQTGLFEVDIARTRYTWQGPHYNTNTLKVNHIEDLLTTYAPNKGMQTEITEEAFGDSDFSPDFHEYDVIISNFGWLAAPWPQHTQEAFTKYMKTGGGLVIVHAANNAWGDWDEYNEMIGLGGWGDRSEMTGPYVYFNDRGERVVDHADGQCGSHGPEHEYTVETRAKDHPIMKGLPSRWLHAQDELYDRLRGPAKNMTVLATAYSGVETNNPSWEENKGSGRHEPVLMAIEYFKGRVFHTIMGHMDYSMECVGFISTFQRGAEWAATGDVTQSVPKDFPNETKSISRPWQD